MTKMDTENKARHSEVRNEKNTYINLERMKIFIHTCKIIDIVIAQDLYAITMSIFQNKVKLWRNKKNMVVDAKWNCQNHVNLMCQIFCIKNNSNCILYIVISIIRTNLKTVKKTSRLADKFQGNDIQSNASIILIKHKIQINILKIYQQPFILHPCLYHLLLLLLEI